MSYYVSLGDLEFDKALSVTRSSDRDISTYDSVGGGKFAVPQNKELREWTIKCELDDFDVIKQLDKIQKSKKPVRLVISSDEYKESERVLLKSHHQEEEYAGVFPTTLKLIEYAKVGVKTAAVPYVAREGTAPALPKTVVLGDGKNGTVTPYDLQMAAARQAADDGEANFDLFLGGFVRGNGKILYNPATIPDNTPVTVSLDEAAAALAEKSAKGVQETKDFFSGIGNKASSYWDYLTKTPTDVAIKDWAKKATDTMSKAYEGFMNENP